ncbi:MAG: GIY-YIG nuclease family protein, partial [Minisyncoccia bacterium]
MLSQKFYLYILKSLNFNRYYIGISSDLDKRIKKHNNKSVRSTKFYIPWKLVYFEEFDNKTLARKRELFLKKNCQARQELFEKIN